MMKVEFSEKDQRVNGGILMDISPDRETVFRSGAKSIELYSYQVDSVNIALTKQRGIIKCATGSYLFYGHLFPR
jgi:hypothetical protein